MAQPEQFQMTPERWARLKELYAAAIEMDEAGASEFLVRECREDSSLLYEARALVREHSLIDGGTRSVGAGVDSPVPGRFEVLERTGGGTFGDVYKVRDSGTGRLLALKVLREPSPSALLQFKREFRMLCRLHHPNLVQLYEFFAIGERWMFTMEFVNGRTFLEFVRGDLQSDGREREDRLRVLLPQIAAALGALHGRGLLHRDLKPSNVMVDGERLVLLDFGLVHSFDDAGAAGITLAGTPDYMSPEQAAGRSLTEASDWYSVGVMVYQALTGVLPFEGPILDVLQKKQQQDPPPPRAIRAAISPESESLCLGLLSRDPVERLRHAASLGLIREAPQSYGTSGAPPLLFVGRQPEIDTLQQLSFRAKGGTPGVVHVAGPSGIGKSILLRRFAALQATDPNALVLSGRCHESESVPYPGLDDLVDALFFHLRHLPEAEVEQVLPRNFLMVARMFPVLRGLRPPGDPGTIPPDTSEFRSRAFGALREMLGRIAERRRLILIIDDLQWGDLDTGEFLKNLMETRDAPQALLVLAYRSEDVHTLLWLQGLRTLHEKKDRAVDSDFINLGPLSPEESQELTGRLTRSLTWLKSDDLTAIVNQSGGDPFLMHEMTRFLEGNSGDLPAAMNHEHLFSLEDALQRRFDVLSANERRALELVGVAGAPLESEVLASVCGGDLPSIRIRLVSVRLLRSRIVQGREQLEVYHDRIRAAVVRSLQIDQVRSLHLELALALERTGRLDPEALATHYATAGYRDKAAAFAAQAAQRAVNALAFNKAADFYHLACENEIDPGQRAQLSRRLGEVLSSAGRGDEAALAYLAAAQYAGGRDKLEILSLAAGQFIRTGEMRRGVSLLNDVLKQANLQLPSSAVGRLFVLGVSRQRIRLRGLAHKTRAARDLNPEELFRLELVGRAALSFALSDPLGSAVFSSRYLVMALEAGEPAALSMALAGAAIHHSLSSGRRAQSVPSDYLRRARQLADISGDSRAPAFVRLMSGLVHYLRGNWEEATSDCDAAASAFRETCTGVVWELTLALMFSLIALSNRGDWAEVRRRIPALVRDAQMRGDLQQWLHRILACTFASYLAVGESDEALQLLEAAAGAWPNETYNIQTCNSLLGAIGAYLYLEKPEEAWVRLQRQWPSLKRSRLLYLPTTSAFVYFARGRLAIAMAARENCEGAKSWLRMARHDARSIESRGPRWSYGFAHLLRSGIASLGADLRAVQVELTAAEARFREADLQSFRMAAIYRIAQISPDRAMTMQSEISAWIEREEIREPEKVMAMLAPGRWSRA